MTHKPRRLARTFWIRTASIVFVATFAAAALVWCGAAGHSKNDDRFGAYSFHTSDLLVDNTSTLSSATASTMAVYNASKQFVSYAGSGCGSGSAMQALTAGGGASCLATGSGTVTSITCGTGLTCTPANPITGAGTITATGALAPKNYTYTVTGGETGFGTADLTVVFPLARANTSYTAIVTDGGRVDQAQAFFTAPVAGYTTASIVVHCGATAAAGDKINILAQDTN